MTDQPVRARLCRDGLILANDYWPFGEWGHDEWLGVYYARVHIHTLHNGNVRIAGARSKPELRRLIAAVIEASPRWTEREKWR